ncbi:probable ATP-dependent RNA helicase DDX20 [Anoplophora glabripennis]|uniref:probable ATP-dependent RNA helicase DDX20 n=1 Tax=Anoplophora glabripennis TaxID=217634 RepID=UPI000873FA9E|nr:probable ATP-dependent RNA helicase DDX20 [Anoplophora glabripennis]
MSQIIAHSLEVNNRTKDVTIHGNITFESLMLSENVLKGIKESGFRKPSPIQLKSIPVGRCGFDIIVKSKSGTGKTLVFSIIALETIAVEKHETQILILAPTREIAVQIQEVIVNIGSHINGLKVESFIGGLPLEGDKEKCKNCHIAVGTPGRVKQLIDEGVLKPNSIHLLVLDEVDKLMECSFINDINEIFNCLPDRKQIITTSATYPEELSTFLNKYMLSLTYIEVETGTPLLLGLKQFVKIIKPYTSVIQEIKFKNEELLNLFSMISFTQCLIFTNYQTRAESISNYLNQKGWCSMFISAAQSQPQRLETVKNLKNFKCKILLSTDLTARGIDAAKVDLVVNYDIPTSAVTYLHRMGRAGRYGSSGVCVDFVSSGVALHQWQCMLGVIGGCSLGIPKLPICNSSVSDLLKLESSSDNCIFGIIDDSYVPEMNTSIKKNVLDLKRKKNAGNVREEEIGRSSYSEGKDTGLSGLNSKETTKCVTNHSTEDLDPSVPLNKPSDGTINRNHGSCSTFKQLTSTFSDTSRVSSALIDRTNESAETPEKNIFYKNKALLFVTQILSRKKLSGELEPDLNVLHYYIDAIKNQDKSEIAEIASNTRFRSVEELLKNIEEIDYLPGTEKSKFENSMEDIFKIGYHCATKSNSRHWSSYLPKSELNNFKNLRLKERLISNDSDKAGYTENSDDYEGDEFSDMPIGRASDDDADNRHCNPEVMKWTCVEKEDNIDRYRETYDGADWDHLNSYFDQCSESLWQLGLCFESIEDFDCWFYRKWQSQVFSVRDYVQQNLYVREMNQYQESRYNPNKK